MLPGEVVWHTWTEGRHRTLQLAVQGQNVLEEVLILPMGKIADPGCVLPCRLDCAGLAARVDVEPGEVLREITMSKPRG